MHSHPSQGAIRQIEGAEAQLTTTEKSAFAHIRTRELHPNHVYTLWWVVINDPGVCDSSPCTAGDGLERTDAVEADVTYGDGVVAGPDGTAVFNCTLHRGTLDESWFGNGFTDPQNTEIHLVINRHGPSMPSLGHTMSSSYRRGCRSDTLPGKFPATAKADGIPGPNACALVQDAIFRQ